MFGRDEFLGECLWDLRDVDLRLGLMLPVRAGPVCTALARAPCARPRTRTTILTMCSIGRNHSVAAANGADGRVHFGYCVCAVAMARKYGHSRV